jgi:hypothetical protein
MAVIVATLAAWLVSRALPGNGLLILRVVLDLGVWVVVFYLTRSFLSHLRPGE